MVVPVPLNRQHCADSVWKSAVLLKIKKLSLQLKRSTLICELVWLVCKLKNIFWENSRDDINNWLNMCGTLTCYFYRAKQLFAIASEVLGIVILSVRQSILPSICPSGCHTHALRRNERTYCRYFDTIWKGNHSGFLIPTEVGGRCPLPSEICS